MSDEAVKTELEPLKIKCSSSRCASNLHYFRQTKKMRENNEPPICKVCKADLVDWPRVRQCDLNDVEHTFLALKLELVRHSYWHRPFDQKAINYALRKGKVELFKAAESRIRSSVGRPADAFDWSGTSWEGNPICYAQHATAACCRKCIEKWHGIPRDQPLKEDQIKYLTRLVVMYLEDRFPDLPDYKQKVPSLRGNVTGKAQK
jgi:hypothetical protein